jgi:membrane fusion protein, multidrug efflux system
MKRGFSVGMRPAIMAAAVAGGTQLGCGARENAHSPPPPTVTVAQASVMTVPVVAYPIGTTTALENVTIQARVRGFLTEMHFKEGSNVKAGQLLFVIDEIPFKVALDATEAKLDDAKAALARAKQSKAREIASAQLAFKQAVLYLARLEETRQRNLVSRNAAPQQELDRAEAERKKDEADVEAARAQYEQAKVDYDVNILSAEANVNAAQADVAQAKLDLGYCRMSSPINGRVGKAKVKVGNLVRPAAGSQEYTELVSIQQLQPMGIDAQVSSRYLERANRLIKQGLAGRLIRSGVDGEQEYPYPMKGLFIDNTIDPATSTFLIRSSVENPQEILLPGEYVKLSVQVESIADAVVVPEQAVIETQAGEVVYTVDSTGKVALLPVKASSNVYQGLRVINSGLKGGQVVIVEGIQDVRPGQAVKTEPYASPSPAGSSSPAAAPSPSAEPRGSDKPSATKS